MRILWLIKYWGATNTTTVATFKVNPQRLQKYSAHVALIGNYVRRNLKRCVKRLNLSYSKGGTWMDREEEEAPTPQPVVLWPPAPKARWCDDRELDNDSWDPLTYVEPKARRKTSFFTNPWVWMFVVGGSLLLWGVIGLLTWLR